MSFTINTKINGKSVRLCFDSGSSVSALCPQAVTRLGLKFIPGPTNHYSLEGFAGHTEDCTLVLEGTKGKSSFLVLDLPAYVSADFDGLIGWWTIRSNILQIDAVAREVTFLPKVPAQAAQWTRLNSDLMVARGGTTKRP